MQLQGLFDKLEVVCTMGLRAKLSQKNLCFLTVN
jgi:hypothetical protein